MNTTIPILGFAAPSGTGKTTLMEQVITELTRDGFKVGAIKHGHHPADPDVPGKDTHRFRQAGARTVLFACPQRWFMIQELDPEPEPDLYQQVALFHGHDLVLVEGYKNDSHPKIGIYRRGVTQLDSLTALTHMVAIATDDWTLETTYPLLPLYEPGLVAHFIVKHLGLLQDGA